MKIIKNTFLSLLIVFIFTYSAQKPEAIDSSGAIVGAAAATAALAMYQATSAIMTPSIGGLVTWISPCTNPPAINFVTVQASPPFVGSGMWMFLPGSVPFAYGPPAYPTQPVLGKAFLGYVPCFTGTIPTGPGGMPVLYTGTGTAKTQ